jgi:hypothetical protein
MDESNIVRLHCEIKELQSEVKALRDELRQFAHANKASNDKMDQHIDFIENVYCSFRHPLDYMKKKIESWSGTKDDHSLPQLDDGRRAILDEKKGN